MPGNCRKFRLLYGAVAQLGERLNGIQEVRSSTLLGSTNLSVNRSQSVPGNARLAVTILVHKLYLRTHFFELLFSFPSCTWERTHYPNVLLYGFFHFFPANKKFSLFPLSFLFSLICTSITSLKYLCYYNQKLCYFSKIITSLDILI